MKISVELEHLIAVEKALEEIPAARPIERCGLLVACYNTIKQMREEAEKNGKEP